MIMCGEKIEEAENIKNNMVNFKKLEEVWLPVP